MIAVLGATGNIGSKLSKQLLASGKKVRVMARTETKLNELKNLGAEVVIGDVHKLEDLKRLFAGAEAAFVMIPPNYQAQDFLGHMASASEKIVAALQQSSVTHVVNLSSLGAHRDSHVGPVRGLHAHEQRMAALQKMNVLHLRPAYFMENFLANLSLMQEQRINGGSIKKGIQFPTIATQDIADEAFVRLTRLDFKDHSYIDLLGAQDVDVESVTAAFSEALKIPNLPYVEFSYPDFKNALLGFQFSEQAADLMVELVDGLNHGKFTEATERNSRTTTKTTFPEFLQSVLGQAAS